jgi:predicted ATPase/DNA-binding CsgD family transcriptional regulator
MKERKLTAYDYPVENLTSRELEVLILLSQHLRYQDIADKLTLAITSVKWYAQQIYRKLSVDNRRDAVERARQLGIMEGEQAARSSSNETKVPSNLPRPLNRFIGRERQIAEVKALVINNPLVTLTGSGGVGKTRLVQVVAREMEAKFQHGVCLVELAPLVDANLLTQTVATALALQKAGESSYLEILFHSLREKQVLLIFDNCEHLLDACAQLAETLLTHCPQLTMLATSREKLGIYGETVYRVPSMAVPDPDRTANPVEMEQSEAVQLFVDRAASTQPGFQLSKNTVQQAAEICQRLDGIPLAIELAAAQTNSLSLEQIASRLDDCFHLLTAGSRTALPRHQTLRASIDWSYSLLTEKERLLLHRLSVFSGGCTLDAAEGVCGVNGFDQGEVLEELMSLVNKSLVVASPQAVTGNRYRMLETIRQFAIEKLEQSGESETVRDAHLQFFLALALEDGPQLKTERIVETLHKLDPDLDNLRAALSWAVQRGGQDYLRSALQLICKTHYFWATRALYWEIFPRLIHLLEQLPADTDQNMEIKAWGYYTLSALQADFNIEVQTIGYLNECIPLFRQLHNQPGLALALALRSYLIFRHHQFFTPHPAMSLAEAESQQAKSFAIANEFAQNPDREAQSACAWVYCWNGAGDVFHMNTLNAQKLGNKVKEWFLQLGDSIGEQYGILIYLVSSIVLRDVNGLDSEIDYAIQSAKRIGHKRFLSFFINQKVNVQMARKQYRDMAANAHEGLALQQQLGSLIGEAENYRHLGIAYTHLEELPQALSYLQRGIRLLSQVMEYQSPYQVIELLVGICGVAQLTGQYEIAAKLIGYIEAHVENFQRPIDLETAQEFAYWQAAVKTAMDERDYRSLYLQGRELSMSQAVTLALDLEG